MRLNYYNYYSDNPDLERTYLVNFGSNYRTRRSDESLKAIRAKLINGISTKIGYVSKIPSQDNSKFSKRGYGYPSYHEYSEVSFTYFLINLFIFIHV